MSTLRILIADDHAMVRGGVRNVIEKHAGWTVCGEAADGRTALDAAQKLAPDIAIVDIALPGMNGLALTLRLRETCPDIKTLLFSMIDDDETVASGVAAGARGYLLKSDDGHHLEAAISTLAKNGTYFSAAIADKARATLQDGSHNPLEVFTTRELEVIQLVGEGKSNKTIAHMLGISPRTVEVHRSAAMRKADARSAAELVRFAIRHRLIQV
ncbi:MAG TPA: response regulator transcription factor [Hyphomonadaceae bacterium]|nr:response regulator transcription factor [Hyphomonadaceae bacterium]